MLSAYLANDQPRLVIFVGIPFFLAYLMNACCFFVRMISHGFSINMVNDSGVELITSIIICFCDRALL